ncbi:hypothetical protein MP638_000598 [Amoeboaphelidium occidentale]|nr:hypothetical protein MP638_000598 [Amoeboaphelidium occidentale]
MDFALEQLQSFGWSEGNGLGKNGQGVSTPIIPVTEYAISAKVASKTVERKGLLSTTEKDTKLKKDSERNGFFGADEKWSNIYESAMKGVTVEIGRKKDKRKRKDKSIEKHDKSDRKTKKRKPSKE